MRYLALVAGVMALLAPCLATGQAVDFDARSLRHGGSPLGPAGSQGFAAAVIAGEEILFGSETFEQLLVTIDPATTDHDVVGGLNSPVVAALAFDEGPGLLYATDTYTNDLMVVDLQTAEIAVIGNTGLELPHGAAIDPVSGILYVAEVIPYVTSHLYTVDKATAQATFVGDIGVAWVGTLDFDPTSGVLYAAVRGPEPTGALLTVDTTTGHGTIIGSTQGFSSVVFTDDGQLLGIENWSGGLYTVNKQTGDYALIGIVELGNVLGLDFVDEDVVGVERASWGSLKATYR